MNRTGRIHRFNIFAQFADRCEPARRHRLDEKTKNCDLAAHGFGCIWGCLCSYDVLAGIIVSLYLPGEIPILCRDAMDRFWLRKSAILFTEPGGVLYCQFRSGGRDIRNSLLAAKLG